MDRDNEVLSEGKCVYCNKLFPQKGMIKHLNNHLAVAQAANSTTQEAYFINIKTSGYFLHVLVKGSAEFDTLDVFLREIWVDCCGHLSDFSHKKFDIEMSDKFEDILIPKLIFQYDYDYGSTTRFSLEVIDVYNIAMQEDVILLSRNEPLKLMCHSCKKNPAINMCSEHMQVSDEYMFCAGCSKEHEKECDDFADYASIPISNSPRSGVCAYTGGSIDLERDGMYKM